MQARGGNWSGQARLMSGWAPRVKSVGPTQTNLLAYSGGNINPSVHAVGAQKGWVGTLTYFSNHYGPNLKPMHTLI